MSCWWPPGKSLLLGKTYEALWPIGLGRSYQLLQSLHNLSYLLGLEWPFAFSSSKAFFQVPAQIFPPLPSYRMDLDHPPLDFQPHISRIPLYGTGLLKRWSTAPAHFPFLDGQGLCVICLCTHPAHLPPRARKYFWHMVNARRF